LGKPEKIRIIIADDHAAFRQAAGRLLSEEPGLEVIGEAGDGEEAVALTQKLNPDLVIMDISMPKLNGIEATRKIKEVSKPTIVMILSAFNYRTYLKAALQAGAAGYITKDTPFVKIVKAIHLAFKRKNRTANQLV
jgi:two-component system, NarL family, response regulator DesR